MTRTKEGQSIPPLSATGRAFGERAKTRNDDANNLSHHSQDREVKADSTGPGHTTPALTAKAANNHSRRSRGAGRDNMEPAGDRGAWHKAATDMVAARPDRLGRQAAKLRQFRIRLDSPERAGAYSVAGRQQFGSDREPRCRRGARHPAYRPSAARRCPDIAERTPGCESSSRRSTAQARE